MFEGLINLYGESDSEDNKGVNDFENEKDICDVANEEIDRFDKLQTIPLTNPDGSYVNPLPR